MRAPVKSESDAFWLTLAGALREAIVGEVGDPTPTPAIEDELRDFGADEVIVVTHPRDRETRHERAQLTRLQSELDVPVTQIVVGDPGEQTAIAV
ncbi:MAG: hypothetical protein ABSG43_08900 [Solirubrobacteraceae bacterium]